MFCSNCGNKIPDGSNVCHSCGMVTPARQSDNVAQNRPKEEKSEYVNMAYQKGVSKAQTGYVEPVSDYVPENHKKHWSRGTIFGICAVAVAVLIGIFGLEIAFSKIDHRNANRNSAQNNFGFRSEERGDGYGSGHDDYDDDMYEDYVDEFFRRYGGMFGDGIDGSGGEKDGYGGGYGGYGRGDGPNENIQDETSPFPTDDNGNTYMSPNYGWPKGDGKYEYYKASTIPSFESVTGNLLISTEIDQDEYVYYKYDLDMEAYAKYLDVLKEYGYIQTQFDAQGRDSYVIYENEGQYLILYLMNSDNQIVIMA